ncbi:MAG: D-alanine--D-alanine ligase, partial [Candidatus Pacearchaeota archaeon]
MGKKKIKNVLVLLGDASYPDPVKKGNKFNPEDFEVIWQLKQALSLLQGYNFEYFPDYIKEGNGFYQKGRHDELEKKLDEAKTNCDFVLNFCDEGFKNDPEKEALIPELLESYGLRYSGAGPRCLLLCYNKWAVKAIARYANIPVTKHLLLTPGQEIKALPFDFPAFVKPNYGDGSFCIDEKSLVKNFDELVKQVKNIRQKCRALGRDETLLIE